MGGVPSGYAPPGWPGAVRPPGAQGWEATAAAFLLDCCPSDFRAYPVLRRHPVVLARFAAEFVAAQVSAASDGLGRLRLDLSDQVDPEVVQAAVEAWEEQSAHLLRLKREVSLVEEALRGRVFVRRLT
ncbi:MAG: hypothetical protein QM779_05225 [Propionicimonas sp.]|uniref:hypothetical protein n=1 Tax=Propionicimonas sp. TaxID=1955623 RepID=UPI003D116C66